MTNTDYSLGSPGVQSAGTSPRRVPRKSPKRIGKPPNILILCENEAKRSEIGIVLKAMLANDRYAIYDIRWDQLGVGVTIKTEHFFYESNKKKSQMHNDKIF